MTAAALPDPADSQLPAAPIVSPPVSILIVDDVEANLVALEGVLEPLGHRIVRASSGEAALRHVLNEPFALILMDGQMPGMDGFQTAALIKQRERTRDIPLIFVSAVYCDVGYATRGYSIGAVDYIVKPFEPDILRAKVGAIIKEFQHREEMKRQEQLLAAEEQRRVAEQSARQAAEASNRMKDEFIAMVSHELRTPLQAILGWATRLRAGSVAAAELPRAGEVIYRNVHLQSRLVNDLLDSARIASGKLELNLRVVDAAEVIRHALEALDELATTSEVTIAFAGTPCSVRCDPDRLEQIVANLVSNAIRFSRRGGVVRVATEATDDVLQIAVNDEGIGIASESLPRLFEPFWQDRRWTIGRSAGLGLGLSIVRHLVELHGGTISAESGGRDLGASFRIVLPRFSKGEAREISAPLDGIAPRLDGLRILVVDDEADLLDVASEFLSHLGAEVKLARSAAAAIAAMRSERFHAVVADISMPERDGLQLLEDILALGPVHAKTPAIAISAHTDPAMQKRCLSSGFREFVGKPFLPHVLASAVARHVASGTDDSGAGGPHLMGTVQAADSKTLK